MSLDDDIMMLTADEIEFGFEVNLKINRIWKKFLSNSSGLMLLVNLLEQNINLTKNVQGQTQNFEIGEE